ncbi:MAG: hypothetical protein HND57_07030 [Planctomycetes bacterium]|nr:hypothetical protein [Planctomycetota bacterium]
MQRAHQLYSLRTLLAGLTVAVITHSVSPEVHAQCGPVEVAKLLAADGAMDDEFGYRVAISGTTAVVGAWEDQDNGLMSGSAFLFDTTTGAQIAKLLPADGRGGDRFGVSVAISGTTAIIGARMDDDNGTDSGSAYLFDTTTGMQITKLLPTDGASGSQFGVSVAISGTIAIVGAHSDEENGSASGSAYLFNTMTGEQIAKLLPTDGAAFDYFGFRVAISGTTAIVAATGDADNGLYSGSAYLFDTTTGTQIAKLLPTDGAERDAFGESVAINGTIAIVGANQDDDNGVNSGSAYLFDSTTGAQIAKLLPTDGAGIDSFGVSVAISGTTAVVGAFGDDDNGDLSGSAYLFDTTTGEQIAKFLPADGAEGDQFGRSVAIGGTTVIVGARDDDDNGTDSGSAYVFELEAPVLRAAATCPGGGPIAIDWSCTTPAGRIAVIFAANRGNFAIPGMYPCAGTQLGLGVSAIRIAYQGTSDATGSGTLNASAPSVACGAYLQLIDLDSCTVSNVVRIE